MVRDPLKLAICSTIPSGCGQACLGTSKAAPSSESANLTNELFLAYGYRFVQSFQVGVHLSFSTKFSQLIRLPDLYA